MATRFRLYIDESGDHSYGKKEFLDPGQPYSSNYYYPELNRDYKRYLALIGIIIEDNYYKRTFQPDLEALKQTHFPFDPDHPVILHRDEIVKKKGVFGRLRNGDAEKSFNESLLRFLTMHQYMIILVVIDKASNFVRYGQRAYDPYQYCMTALLERYCNFLTESRSMGDVLAERRGNKEDRELRAAYSEIYKSGTRYYSSEFFQQRLTSGEIKIGSKTSNNTGLQTADLLAHPLKLQLLAEEKRIEKKPATFADSIYQAVQGKFRQSRTGEVSGYGKVFLK